MEHARILIVEDDPLIAEDLAAMLAELGHSVCGIAHRAERALVMADREHPDLALLDIRLHDGPDGVDVARAMGARGIPFIYVTSHTDPATLEQVAGTKPQGFIIKPFDREDLHTQITVALARIRAEASAADGSEGALFVRDRGRLVRVPVDDILFAEADDNYTTLHTTDRKYVLVSSLTAVEDKLKNPFLLRVHRKFAVDIRRISSIEGTVIRIGAVTIPVGRTHRVAVNRRLRRL